MGWVWWWWWSGAGETLVSDHILGEITVRAAEGGEVTLAGALVGELGLNPDG